MLMSLDVPKRQYMAAPAKEELSKNKMMNM